MLTGSVSPNREAILTLTLRDSMNRDHRFDAVIDTGYTGSLSLPPSEIALLGLTWLKYGSGTLADGTQISYDVFEGVILWDGHPRAIQIASLAGGPLIGMSLMYGYELNLPVLDGATFTLRPISNP